MSTFTRKRVLDCDIISGNLDAPGGDNSVVGYEGAHVLVRVHESPIGMIDVVVEDAFAIVESIRRQAWIDLGPEISAHLAADGEAVPTNAYGLAAVDTGCPSAMDDLTVGPLVTIAIPSLRNVDSTVASVHRLLAGTYTNFEVVVVDNDSDATALSSAIEKAFGEDQRVRYAHEPRIGVSHARNKGLAEAAGEIVVFIDDDVYVDRRWLDHIVRSFDAHVACVTGSILPAEMETEAQGWLEQYGGFNKGFARQVYDLDGNSRGNALYPFDAGRFGSGANMAFRTEILRSLGGFATDLGPGTPTYGGEDIDVLRHVVTSGYTLVYEPAALMWHFHRRSTAALRKQMFRYGVGFSALVTKWLLDGETRKPVLSRIPTGVSHVFKPGSAKNEKRESDYPLVLTGLEILGIAVGPVAYIRSRIQTRQRSK